VLIRLAREVVIPGDVVVDVGADHGHVAHALGAIATEALPGRIGRRDVPWVVGDGLTPFRHVGVAIVAGMGWRTIGRILDAGPRPTRAVVVHAQDDPPALRVWLAEHGWRIDAEALAPEAGRFAEILRAVPGAETATGHTLAFGPVLLRSSDPFLREHLAELAGHYDRLAGAIGPSHPSLAESMQGKAAFLWGILGGSPSAET
jgi:tRNA (adenine22-N1)-methyltransferase